MFIRLSKRFKDLLLLSCNSFELIIINVLIIAVSSQLKCVEFKDYTPSLR